MSVKTDTLESLCELIVDCPHSTPKWTDEGIIVLRNQNIKNGTLNLDLPSFTNEEGYQSRIKRATPQAGDIVFTREAPMGEVCIMPENLKCCLGQRQVLLRPKNDVCGKYLFWALQSPFVQHQISWNEGTGSTVSNVRIPVLKALNIPRLHGLEESIAKALSDLADKIELNRQTNQTLEHIAQAIFKSWFVDFEPTRVKIAAKENGQNPELAAMGAISGKPATKLEKLDAAQLEQLKTTAALFPDALVESELGEIPEGWELKSMKELSTIVAMGPFDSNIKVSTFVEEGIPVISGQHLKGIMLKDNEYNYLTIKHADKLNKSNVQRGDIVFTHAGSIGQVAYIPENSRYDRYVLSQRQFYMRPNQELISPLFIVNYFKSHVGQYELLANTSQVGVPSISRPVSNLRKIQTAIPKKDLSDEFHKVVSNLYNKVSEMKAEIISLEELRNTLLPKLFSGELIITPQNNSHRQESYCA